MAVSNEELHAIIKITTEAVTEVVTDAVIETLEKWVDARLDRFARETVEWEQGLGESLAAWTRRLEEQVGAQIVNAAREVGQDAASGLGMESYRRWLIGEGIKAGVTVSEWVKVAGDVKKAVQGEAEAAGVEE